MKLKKKKKTRKELDHVGWLGRLHIGDFALDIHELVVLVDLCVDQLLVLIHNPVSTGSSTIE